MRAHWFVLLILLCGCDADRFLSGQWTTTTAIDLSQLGLSDSEGQSVNIELNLGHYGQDVVGVTRFVATEDHNFDSLGCEPVDELPACPCNRIDGTFKSSSGKFYFDLVNCIGNKHQTVLHESGDLLLGIIEMSGGGELEVEFEATASEIELTSSDKTCDLCD